MKRIPAIIGPLIGLLYAGLVALAQTPVRHIVRTNDISIVAGAGAVAWYSGETITYDLLPKTGADVFVPGTGATATWLAVDATYTNRMMATNGVFLTNRYIRFVLPAEASAWPVRDDYYATVNLIQTNGDQGVIDAFEVRVLRRVAP